MRLDDETCYRALLARDARFDGLFFVAVTTTRIYCRPICSARTPGRDRCRFFGDAAGAERAGFRPCLRCRPELAPGHAPVDAVGRTARAAAARIEAGALNEGGNVETLARELGLSARQLRRAVRQEFGVSPIELAQTRRLLLAKQLIADSDLPLIQVALASGFGSARRFNALFRSHYRLTPTAMRRSKVSSSARGAIRLTLAYRPPLAWDAMLDFLAARNTSRVEGIAGRAYFRTAAIGPHRGWLKVGPVEQTSNAKLKPRSQARSNALEVELSTALAPALPEVIARLKGLFDLSARPDAIAAHLAADPRLGPIIGDRPCPRAPGAFDGFELAVRAILGQRISVRAASTLAGRLAARFGEPIESPFPELDRLSPAPERIANASVEELSSLGVAAPRAAAILAVARGALEGTLDLRPGAGPEPAIAALQEIPGIGDWTAQYIAMRALRWPDAFPAGDLGLVRAFSAQSARELRTAAERWRPWRAYAAMYLWESLSARAEGRPSVPAPGPVTGPGPATEEPYEHAIIL